MARLTRPSDVANFLAYVRACAPVFGEGSGLTTESAIEDARIAVGAFRRHTTDPDCDALLVRACDYLALALEHYQGGNNAGGADLVATVEELFEQARAYLPQLDYEEKPRVSA